MSTTTDERQRKLKAAVRKAIDEPKQRQALYRCMKRGRDKRTERLVTVPGGAAFRAEVRAIKERCIAEQDTLLAKFIRNAEARGVQVFVAKDGPEAIAYCLKIALENHYKTVSKSKSLTTEEIEINQDLEDHGIQVIETDLGELIIQLVGEKPYHLVFPSVHKMTADVAKIFADATGKDVAPDIPSIMPVVRAYLRPIFLNTDIGMTGANVGIAETGGIVIETNEGNARLVSSIGKCHICVMGMEKIVDTIEDAMMMVFAHPVSAVGQLPTTYVTWMHGRAPLGEGGPDRASHIVILDNGRTRMREDPLMREALHCIRCGACMNICPTYGVIGGHTFGYIYPGPIGIPWTAEAHGLETAGNFAELCVSCGLCKEICPADIDMPLMIAEVKHRDMADHPPSIPNQVMMDSERAAQWGCRLAPLSNWALRNPLVRLVMEKALGVERKRELPLFARKTLQQMAASSGGSRRHGGEAAPRKVAYFHDLFTNYNRPDLGLAVIAALEDAGCEVVVPDQIGCGYPYIAYGDLDRARDAALHNLARLAPLVAEGYEIVTSEPTAAYALKKSWPKLLPHHPHAQAVASATHELFDFLAGQASSLSSPAPSAPLAGKRFAFHTSCHQRPLSAGDAAIRWLERQGAAVERVESGTCCGMAGTFGLKHGPLGYDLANAVGEPLFESMRAARPDAILTESSVCAMHLAEGTGLRVLHPLELLDHGGRPGAAMLESGQPRSA